MAPEKIAIDQGLVQRLVQVQEASLETMRRLATALIYDTANWLPVRSRYYPGYFQLGSLGVGQIVVQLGSLAGICRRVLWHATDPDVLVRITRGDTADEITHGAINLHTIYAEGNAPYTGIPQFQFGPNCQLTFDLTDLSEDQNDIYVAVLVSELDRQV